jgi:hypothetical protein
MKKFTIEEIQSWLNGRRLTYSGLPHTSATQYNRTIDSISRELDDFEEGIEAVTQRMQDYKYEDRE